MKSSLTLLGLLFFCTSLVGKSSGELGGQLQCIQTHDTLGGIDLMPHMVHYWDPKSTIRVPNRENGAQLSLSVDTTLFESLGDSNKVKHLGENQSNHWFQFCLHNTSQTAQNLVVALGPATMAELDFYPQKPGLPSFKTGSTRKMSTRDIVSSKFDFTVRLLPDERQTFFIRSYADTNPHLQARLWDISSYETHKNRSESRFGLFVGVLIGLIIYNAMLFVTVRQWSSLLYIAWSLSIVILLSALDGRLVQHLTPEFPQATRIVNIVFYPLSVFLTALFYREFIGFKAYPWMNNLGTALQVAGLAGLVVAYYVGIDVFFQACAALGLTIAFYYGVVVPVYAYAKHCSASAKHLLIAEAPLVLCTIDRTLFVIGITDQFYVPLRLQNAMIITMILVSYFIGLRVYREKQAAQRNALEQLNISNTLKSNYNAQLEQELKQKTAEIRSMNSDLERQAQKLLQLDESKSRFFANISHEFRTPLTLIEGPLITLLEHETAKNKETIRGVIKHADSLKQLIDQILVLSELDDNALDLKASPLDMVETIKELSAQFESLCADQGIGLSVKSDQAVINAYVDVEKLQIVMNNLLSNAIKFTDTGGQVNVTLSSTVLTMDAENDFSQDEYVEITVADTGQGIPAPELAHVFDRYFQSESSKLSGSGIGTGIGLALVKELVELHGGTVRVDSVFQSTDEPVTEPTGTTFRVTLPLGRAHLTDNEIVSASTPVYTNTDSSFAKQSASQSESESAEQIIESNAPRLTVLVVDDNKDMRNHIRQLLAADYHVTTASDGLVAEAALKEHQPALIITDLMMPNRDGLEFVRSIKQQEAFANIPIIMLTARAGLRDRIEGLMAAVDDYLIKPFNGQELKARIQNLLNKQARFDAFYQAVYGQPKLTTAEAAAHPDQSVSGQLTTIRLNSYLERMKTIVEQRLMESGFGVEELAKAMHTSEATLRRRLAEQANFTPAAFIRHCRLDKARQLAAEGNMRSLAELAQAVGFKETTYFARLYKKTFNQELQLRPPAQDTSS